jgi:hypothetical protein
VIASLLFLTGASLAAPAAPPPTAGAGAIVAWAAESVPDARARARVEKLTGAAQHLAWSDLALAQAAVDGRDSARRTALEAAVASAESRWDGFDVEADLARELAAVLDDLTLLREEDRPLVERALLRAGAAALRLAPQDKWATAPAAAPFRTTLAGKAVPTALVHLVALDPARAWTREEVPDAATLTALETVRDALGTLPRAQLAVRKLPGASAAGTGGAQLVVDGRVTAATAPVELAQGHHYVHVLMNGVIAGRTELDVEAGATLAYGPTIELGEVEALRTQVLGDGTPTPTPVLAEAIRARAQRAPIFLAALDDRGRVELEPWENGARIARPKLVNASLTTSLGVSQVSSSAFRGSDGTLSRARGFGGSMELDVAIANLGVYGGAALALTPGMEMGFADANGSNQYLPAYVQPYGGVAVYLPRPAKRKLYAMVGGHFAWQSPGAMGPGARVAVGVPVGGETWLRLDADAFLGTQMTGFPAEGTETRTTSARLGLARAF